jgi:hypothetical protein
LQRHPSMPAPCPWTMVCSPSPGGNSEYAPSPPWTFWAPSDGVQLTVTDVWLAGDIFEVFDFGVSLGTTSSVATGDYYSCGGDPAFCVLDPLLTEPLCVPSASSQFRRRMGGEWIASTEAHFGERKGLPKSGCRPGGPFTHTVCGGDEREIQGGANS